MENATDFAFVFVVRKAKLFQSSPLGATICAYALRGLKIKFTTAKMLPWEKINLVFVLNHCPKFGQ